MLWFCCYDSTEIDPTLFVDYHDDRDSQGTDDRL